MRENCSYGSEGGGAELNQPSPPPVVWPTQFRASGFADIIRGYNQRPGHGPPYLAESIPPEIKHSWRVSFACGNDEYLSERYDFVSSPESPLNLTLGKVADMVAFTPEDGAPRASMFAVQTSKDEVIFLDRCSREPGTVCPVAYCPERTNLMWNSPNDEPDFNWETIDVVSVLFITIQKTDQGQLELQMEVDHLSGNELKHFIKSR